MAVILELISIILHLIFEYLCSLFYLIFPRKEKSVRGQTVLITGAGSGIGQLMSVKFAQKGAFVIGWDINETGLRKTEELVNKAAREQNLEEDIFTFAVVDITNRHEVYAQAEKTERTVDILINNAGIVTSNSLITEKDDEGVIKTFEVNAISHFWTTKAFLPGMKSQGFGHVVTIASVAGFGGLPRISDYCASKFAAIGFHESLAFELRCLGLEDSIHATLICPYLIKTGMFAGVAKNQIDFLFPIMEPEYVASRIVRAILTNEKQVIVPKLGGAIAAAKYLVPWNAWAKTVEILGVNEVFANFVGRSKTSQKN
ncbi:short-chain dehydrogenase/reductase family 16C member 6-like [Convolutriloba macropyga]|uniref:short-chain dehydrogenase/reductase family 16C member 6-like n=1 Tax=Convolutriloba macropyga TaxID=536237 RepID=UPI003F52347A